MRLHAAGRVRFEPDLRVNLVALDRDQAAAGVRRGDADLDFFAGVVLRARELHLQLRVLVERALHDAAADDGETDPAYPAVVLVAQLDHVIARLLGRKLVMQSVRADRDLLGFRDALFQDRLVAVTAVLLLRHDRDVFLRDHVQRDVLERDLVELRIDREQIDARAVCSR